MDDDQTASGTPEPEPRPDPAVEAFARLEARVGGMEQRLDARLSLLIRAVEHSTAERENVGIPDYTPSLAKLGGHIATLAGETRTLAGAPALQLTPEDMAQQIADAARTTREADRATIEKAKGLHREAYADMTRLAGTIRTVREQHRHLLSAVVATALAVSLPWLIYPGWAAGIGSRSWHWPERVARRTLGEASLWDAGIRLMRVGNPEAWQTIVDASDLAYENRDAIAACKKAAVKTKGAVRCILKVRQEP